MRTEHVVDLTPVPGDNASLLIYDDEMSDEEYAGKFNLGHNHPEIERKKLRHRAALERVRERAGYDSGMADLLIVLGIDEAGNGT